MTGKLPSSSKRAIQELRALIFSGKLAAGSDHLESELAALLGMSRTPVREAVLTLEAQGLLELRPRKGVRILPMAPQDMAEIYDILTELESYAAESAAKIVTQSDDLTTLVKAIDDMDTAIAQSDLGAWAAADDKFHTELVRLGGNKRIETVVSMMSDQVRRARTATLFMRPLPTKSNQDHRMVYQAIRNNDAATARDIHRQHRQHAKEIIVDLLQKHHLQYL